MQEAYIARQESAAYVYGDDTAAVVSLLASRFMGSNPAAPYVWRTFNENGIACDEKARYLFDFGSRFPDSAPGDIAWAAGDLWCAAPRASAFIVSCMGPVRVYVNGALAFASAGSMEGDPAQKNRFPVQLQAGFNRFALRCENTLIGFGCALSNAMPQWEPCNFVMPLEERRGEAGFAYTAPMREDFCEQDIARIERLAGLAWLPDSGVPASPLFGETRGYFYAWSALDLESGGTVCLSLGARPESFFVDGARLPAGKEAELSLAAGTHQLLLCLPLSAQDAFAPVLTAPAGVRASLRPPVPVKGNAGEWLYLGAFEGCGAGPEEICALARPFEATGGKTYWRTGFAGVVIRPFVESELYGRWTYPLGVTLYGLLEAGRELKRPEYARYVREHAGQVTGIHAYALYDKAKYGFPGVNHQIAWLDALDDCGSFGSLTLECADGGPDAQTRAVADRIARYMKNEQVRLEDGAFIRRDLTMWIDDLYMSVPFLIRYAKLSGDESCIDDACRQFLLYKKYLFMPEAGLMSHMRFVARGKSNGIPWSRGNGWVFFSLSELLNVLRPDHPDREALVAFFNEHARGLLAAQGANGLWHQILDDPASYEESSSTAMFLCGLSRGLRMGYLDGALRKDAARAARRAWQGLTGRAIDRHGNIYGVCRGSGFSFSRAYYRSLSWNYNDTHGTGILMLAGVELARLARFLSSTNPVCR